MSTVEQKLNSACILGNTNQIEDLISQYGIEIIHPTTDTDKSPLYIATQYGRADVVKLLLNKGASIDAPLKKRNATELSSGSTTLLTPLMKAVSLGNEKICQILIDAKADVDIQDNMGHSALYYAIASQSSNSACVLALIKAGADINILTVDDKNMLTLAREYGNVEIIKLIEAYSDPVKNLKIDQFKEYISKRPTLINREVNQAQDSLLIQACLLSSRDKAEWLINHEEMRSINHQNSNGWNALMALAYKGYHSDLVEVLLSKMDTASLNATNNYGSTALLLACFSGNSNIIQKIYEKDTSQLHRKNIFGISPIMALVLSGDERSIKILFQNQKAAQEFKKEPIHFIMLNLVCLFASLYHRKNLFESLPSSSLSNQKAPDENKANKQQNDDEDVPLFENKEEKKKSSFKRR